MCAGAQASLLVETLQQYKADLLCLNVKTYPDIQTFRKIANSWKKFIGQKFNVFMRAI